METIVVILLSFIAGWKFGVMNPFAPAEKPTQSELDDETWHRWLDERQDD